MVKPACEMMSLFSYVIPHDHGFATSPHGRFLMLATCKPKIRRATRRGDYIVATGSVKTVGNKKLVCAARVDKIMTMADYGSQLEYICKILRPEGADSNRCGDNICYLDADGWHQRPNPFHDPSHTKRDLSGRNVLICNEFWYFGARAIEIPIHLREIIKKGPDHKRIEPGNLYNEFLRWLESLPRGNRMDGGADGIAAA